MNQDQEKMKMFAQKIFENRTENTKQRLHSNVTPVGVKDPTTINRLLHKPDLSIRETHEKDLKKVKNCEDMFNFMQKYFPFNTDAVNRACAQSFTDIVEGRDTSSNLYIKLMKASKDEYSIQPAWDLKGEIEEQRQIALQELSRRGLDQLLIEDELDKKQGKKKKGKSEKTTPPPPVLPDQEVSK